MHLRHSAYADFAAQARLELLEYLGFTTARFKEYHIGPVLFREELIYLKEVPPNDDISMTCLLRKWNETKHFWSFTQELYRGDGVKAAIIHVDGAWIDLAKRKIAVLPPALSQLFLEVTKTSDFELTA